MNDDVAMREGILARVVREIGDDNLAGELDSNSALMSSGLLDSIATLRLVLYLEQTYSISVQAADLTVENFDTVDQIAQFVRANR